MALENGNFSFLMGADLDFQSQAVRDEVAAWGKWYLDATGVDGFRLDAVKHIAAWFFPEWLDALESHAKKDLFIVAEYWTPDTARSRGTSTGWAAASPCSASRSTTTSTTRAAPRATTTCGGCSTTRCCSSAGATS